VAKEFGGKACPANFEELDHLASQVLQRRYNGHSNSKDAIVCTHGELEYRFTLLTKQCVIAQGRCGLCLLSSLCMKIYKTMCVFAQGRCGLCLLSSLCMKIYKTMCVIAQGRCGSCCC
jgi:hypothetical protein